MEDGSENRLPRFKRFSGKTMAERENMGRIYAFGVIGGAVMIVLTAIFSAFKIYILNSDIQAGVFMLLALFLVNGSLAARATTVQKKKELYFPLTAAYMGLFSILMYAMAFGCRSNTASLLIVSALMTVVGMLPVLDFWCFMALWGAELIPALVLVFAHHFSAEGKISVFIMFIMSIVLSNVVVSEYHRRQDYQQNLDNALSEAETDAMTKLLNRRGLQRRLDDIWPHCIRQHSQVAVIMLDIDNFKKYNDTFGHLEGDECIKSVTGAIRAKVKRRTDYAARVGGEEFLVFLTGIDAEQAKKWGMELKTAIEELRIPQAESNFCPFVTVSMGLATAVVQNDTKFETLKAEADSSLYDAKYNGRACMYYRHSVIGKRPSFKRYSSSRSPEPSNRKAGNE